MRSIATLFVALLVRRRTFTGAVYPCPAPAPRPSQRTGGMRRSTASPECLSCRSPTGSAPRPATTTTSFPMSITSIGETRTVVHPCPLSLLKASLPTSRLAAEVTTGQSHATVSPAVSQADNTGRGCWTVRGVKSTSSVPPPAGRDGLPNPDVMVTFSYSSSTVTPPATSRASLSHDAQVTCPSALWCCHTVFALYCRWTEVSFLYLQFHTLPCWPPPNQNN